MPNGDPNMHWRGRTLRAVRRHLRLIEVQTHRLRAKIARLEADHEDDVADYLIGESEAPHDGVADRPQSKQRSSSMTGRTQPSARQQAAVVTLPRAMTGGRREHVAIGDSVADNVVVLDPRNAPHPAPRPGNQALIIDDNNSPTQSRRRTRKTTRPLLVSIGVHAAALLLCLPLSYVTLTNQSVFLLASPPELVDESIIELAVDELSDVEIATTVSEELELEEKPLEKPGFNLADDLLVDVASLDSWTTSENADTLGDIDAMPSDLATLMGGAGKAPGGQPSGPRGSAVFFGAKSRGDRFVFVVDNSDSMSNGRLEHAITELTRCVDSLSRGQSFYVIFVSDQVYPMFYPEQVPSALGATVENKSRLAEWLPRAERATGKNREIITAMNLAASLRPHAVYFLWDGKITHDGVRRDVMEHLTRPNQWSFPIHTLGMGVASPESEYNLTSIARASGGTYRRINLPGAPSRK